MTDYIELSYLDLAFAALLVLFNAGLSLALGLGLERRMLLAALRMTVQLLLVGLVLEALFQTVSLWLTALVALVMVLFAGREILARQERRLAGWWGYGIGATNMLLAGMVVTLLALGGPLRPEPPDLSPWFDPRYAIPLFGMILGNAMTGISLGLDSLTTMVGRERAGIEAQLLLGANRWRAMRTVARQALRTGFTPMLNSMAAAGVVFLPGMMTGQILAGVAPEQAVKYQILLLFLIAGATGLGVLGAVMASVWRLTDDRHRLRLDRLK
ncbi:MAG: ABC transporter permease [Rhodospirillaceae bacterium]|jgi:putative ABC transport system permease protein|nr:ABC transporter permease [Rhodospirillaceae bacterium]MBT4688298.1 ABC transporter permease [Rhodospirillaceae bacterium]MBT5080010.1 ABC transporter permease [Rhodospirillaceae bacterium]MBT5525599.1 ABC transporter permease [Rhodospirillaceae bacterium]MBT5880358.1 ABC transporter permease [Rhodospirillaceae bacterium]